MHILLVHQAFVALDEPGGTRHHELARFLVQRGHRVTIIASPVSYLTGKASGERVSEDETQSGGEGVTILRAYTYPALHRSFLHRIFSFLSFMISSFVKGMGVKGVDVVWGTSPPIFQGVTAWALARLKRTPFLFEVRDLWPAFAIEAGILRQRFIIKASEWLERFLYHHSDQVIVNSPGFVLHVEARGARRVDLIPNGTDASMFDPSANGVEFRRKHGLENKFVAMYAGAHGMSNDLSVLLGAASLLQNNKKVVIMLVGDGKDKPGLVKKAQDEGLSNLVFLPPFPKNEMPEVLAGADACVAILKPLKLYKTVYPNKVFDYMAAGRAVILAIDGVIREVIEASAAGLFVPPGDPEALADTIQRMADDSELCRTMGARGRQYVEMHYDRSDLAEKLAQLVEGLT